MSEGDTPYQCFYVLDAGDRILDWGGPSWAAFAEGNGGAALATASLKGDAIYAHVAGHFTQRFLREFFIAARAAAAPLTRTYRCDSPGAKRLMEMRAGRDEAGALRVEHRLLSETPMAVEVRCRQSHRETCADFRRCSICNRLRRAGEETWREPDEVGAAGVLRVIHTVCADCRSGISAQAPLGPRMG